MAEFAAIEAGFSDDDLGPLHDAVLAGRKAVRLQTCVRARRVMQISGILILLYSVDVLRLLPGTEAGSASLIPFAACCVVGVYLIRRPLPRYPIRSAIGSVLMAGGGIWFALASMTEWLTWLLIHDHLPEVVADLLVDLGAHQPEAGLLALALGFWATATGTWQRRQRRGLVLYESADEGLREHAAPD